MNIRSKLASILFGVSLSCAAATPAMAQPLFSDDFNGPTLGPGWVTWDGYAVQFPSDTNNHASFAMTGSQARISIPSGMEHNMWLLRQAQLTRPFGGDGVYEVKMDSPLDGTQQFGLIFQSSPGTFMIFMLYATDQVRAYVERFVNHQGFIQKQTFGGQFVAPVGPGTGPFYVRVVVDDNPNPTQRTWQFDWSPNGGQWTTLSSGVFENAASAENIGAVQQVGVFAGNHPDYFHSFNARFDYFRHYASLSDMPLAVPAGLTAVGGDGRVDLSWSAVDAADGYGVYGGTTAGGPYTLLGVTTQTSYADLSVTNGQLYAYVVRARRGGAESAASSEVTAIPHQATAQIPTTGLRLALRASALSGLVAEGGSVLSWVSSAGGTSATGSGSTAPNYFGSGINGKPVVRFDGVNDFLTLSNGFADFSAGLSVYVVMRPTVLQSGFKVLMLGNGVGAQEIGLGRAGTSAGYQYFTHGDAGSVDWFNTNDGLVAGQAAMISLRQEPGAPFGTSFAEVAKDGVPLFGKNMWVPAQATRSLNYIGKSHYSVDGLFQGDIAEILIYNRALTTGEQTSVRQYVSQTYGLNVGGPPPVPVPAVVGQTQAAATTAITGAGLVLGTVSQTSSGTVPVGRVISQSPTAGTGVPQGSAVNLVVSTGPSGPPPVSVPAVVGQTQAAATAAITGAGLVLGTVSQTSSPTVPAGRVISQSPTAGTNLPPGSAVNLVVSTGLPPLVAPANLAAVAGNGRVDLSWSAVGTADGYAVYRGTSAAGPHTLLAVTAQTSYADLSVTNGQLYAYVVRARRSGAEGPASSVVTATPHQATIPTAGLTLALRASDLSGVVAEGGLVQSWVSSTGGTSATGSGSTAPTFISSGINGKPIVRFDGANDFLTLSNGFANFSAGMSVYVVMRPTVLQWGFKVLMLGNGAGAQEIGLGRAGESAGYQYFTHGDAGSVDWFNTDDGLVAGQAALISMLQEPGAAFGTSFAEVARNGVPLFGKNVWVPAQATRSLNYIGKSHYSVDGLFQGDIAEILIYNRTLTATEQTSVRQYVSQTYGLTIN